MTKCVRIPRVKITFVFEYFDQVIKKISINLSNELMIAPAKLPHMSVITKIY